MSHVAVAALTCVLLVLLFGIDVYELIRVLSVGSPGVKQQLTRPPWRFDGNRSSVSFNEGSTRVTDHGRDSDREGSSTPLHNQSALVSQNATDINSSDVSASSIPSRPELDGKAQNSMDAAIFFHDPNNCYHFYLDWNSVLVEQPSPSGTLRRNHFVCACDNTVRFCAGHNCPLVVPIDALLVVRHDMVACIEECPRQENTNGACHVFVTPDKQADLKLCFDEQNKLANVTLTDTILLDANATQKLISIIAHRYL